MTSRASISAWAIIAVGWTIASLLAMTRGALLNWPDYVHEDFGIPLTYATHTLSTIAGPANVWDVNPAALATDLLLWLSGLSMVMLVPLVLLQDRSVARKESLT